MILTKSKVGIEIAGLEKVANLSRRKLQIDWQMKISVCYELTEYEVALML